MPYNEPTFYPTPKSLIISDWQRTEDDYQDSAAIRQQRVVDAVSRAEAERDAAYVRALNRPSGPPPTLPTLREPVLPQDFSARLAALDQQVYDRGVAVSRDQLVSQGKERFEELLASDRTARTLSRIIATLPDLSSWASVFCTLGSAGALQTSIQPRTDSERVAGAGVDRERAAQINGFVDLWKCTPEPKDARNILAFRDIFCSLVFGQSLLERLSPDGRVRSHLFVGGSGAKVAYFDEWTSVLEGQHFRVILDQSLWHLLAWLANEKTPPPDPADLASEWFGLRQPLNAQVKLCAAVMEAFILGHSGWSLWNYVGRASRHRMSEERLDNWRTDLARTFPRIAALHAAVSGAFCKQVADAGYSYWQRDEQSARAYLDRTLSVLSNQLSAVVALALDEMLPSTLVARFADWLLCEGKKPKSVPTAEKLEAKLATAFPGSCFRVEVQS